MLREGAQIEIRRKSFKSEFHFGWQMSIHDSRFLWHGELLPYPERAPAELVFDIGLVGALQHC